MTVRTMQCINLEDIDYPWDEFSESYEVTNGAYVRVFVDSEYTDKHLRAALRKAGITENTCLVHVSW